MKTNTYKPAIGSWYWYITSLDYGLNDSVADAFFKDCGWYGEYL